MRQALFDAFGPGGLNWLQDIGGGSGGTPDGEINSADDIKFRSLTASDVSFEIGLHAPKQLLSVPIDLNLLLPGLGLKTDGMAEVLIGFTMPLVVGLSRSEGAYLDVASATDISIDLEVSMPTTIAVMTGNPGLTFANAGGNGTIVRDTGSWILDGFQEGQQITVANAPAAGNNGNYTITSIDASGKTLTLASNVAVAQGPVDGLSIDVKVGPLKATMGNLLPFTLDWDHLANPKFTGTFTVDLRDTSGNNNNRLSSIELEGEPALAGTPFNPLPAAPVPGLLHLTDTTAPSAWIRCISNSRPTCRWARRFRPTASIWTSPTGTGPSVTTRSPTPPRRSISTTFSSTWSASCAIFSREYHAHVHFAATAQWDCHVPAIRGVSDYLVVVRARQLRVHRGHFRRRSQDR